MNFQWLNQEVSELLFTGLLQTHVKFNLEITMTGVSRSHTPLSVAVPRPNIELTDKHLNEAGRANVLADLHKTIERKVLTSNQRAEALAAVNCLSEGINQGDNGLLRALVHMTQPKLDALLALHRLKVINPHRFYGLPNGRHLTALQAYVEFACPAKRVESSPSYRSLRVESRETAAMQGERPEINHAQVIQALVAAGVNPNTALLGTHTPLSIVASHEASPEVLESLLSLGADPLLHTEGTCNALSIAVVRAEENTIKALVDAIMAELPEQGASTRRLSSLVEKALQADCPQLLTALADYSTEPRNRNVNSSGVVKSLAGPLARQTGPKVAKAIIAGQHPLWKKEIFLQTFQRMGAASSLPRLLELRQILLTNLNKDATVGGGIQPAALLEHKAYQLFNALLRGAVESGKPQRVRLLLDADVKACWPAMQPLPARLDAPMLSHGLFNPQALLTGALCLPKREAEAILSVLLPHMALHSPFQHTAETNYVQLSMAQLRDRVKANLDQITDQGMPYIKAAIGMSNLIGVFGSVIFAGAAHVAFLKNANHVEGVKNHINALKSHGEMLDDNISLLNRQVSDLTHGNDDYFELGEDPTFSAGPKPGSAHSNALIKQLTRHIMQYQYKRALVNQRINNLQSAEKPHKMPSLHIACALAALMVIGQLAKMAVNRYQQHVRDGRMAMLDRNIPRD